MNTAQFLSVPRKRKMMGGDDGNDQLPLAGEDPLLRMHFHEPDESTTRKAPVAAAGDPNKRLKVARRAAASKSSASKKTKSTPVELKSPLLHQSCRLFPKCAGVIQSAVEMEPEAATKRAEAARKGNNSSYIVGDVRVPYSLPINILLHQDASLDVLTVMAKAAPEALTMKDGRDECCSLIIALRLRGRSAGTSDDEESRICNRKTAVSIPEEILNANTAAAQLPDKRRNFPLHVAAYISSSFAVINKLYYAYPEALLETNFNGETPLDICIRNGKCSDRSTSFLQEKMDHLKSARLRTMRK